MQLYLGKASMFRITGHLFVQHQTLPRDRGRVIHESACCFKPYRHPGPFEAEVSFVLPRQCNGLIGAPRTVIVLEMN